MMKKKTSLKNLLVKEIIAMIGRGEYKPGKRLAPERVLCVRLNVSRSTLRQGLKELEKFNVVKIVPGSGVYVRDFEPFSLPDSIRPDGMKSAVTLTDIVVARKAVELAAVSLACERQNPAGMENIRLAMVAMRNAKTGGGSSFIEADMAFHAAIVEASENQVLNDAFGAIHKYLQFSQIFSYYGDDEEERTFRQHQKIFTALQSRSCTEALSAMSYHLDSMLQKNN